MLQPAPQDIPLSDIRADVRAQPRAAIDVVLAGEYGQAMAQGEVFPPAVVFREGDVYWLGDGFHRFHGAQGCDLRTLPCIVHDGGLREAILFSVGANAAHGLRRTKEDKERAVRKLLDDAEWSAWSDSQVRKHCSVSLDFVQRLRRDVTYRAVSEKAPVPRPPDVPDVARARARRIEEAGGQPRFYQNRHGSVSVMDTRGIGRRDNRPAPSEAASPSWSPADIIHGHDGHAFPEQRTEDDVQAYMQQGDVEIFHAISAIDKAIAKMPDYEAAERSFPDRLRHTITTHRLEQMASWLTDFAIAWRKREEASCVAAE